MSKSSVKHQEMYKARTPPWKEAYRKRCLDRLREQRQKFHCKLRNIAEWNSDEDKTSLVKNVMAEELKNFHSPEEFCLESWRFEDIDEMLDLFGDIQEELKREEEKLLADYEEYESSLLKEEAILCSAINKLSTDEVVCPICQRSPLMLNKGVIFCKCGLRINTEQDCISLQNVKKQLTYGMEHHVSCDGDVTFSVVKAFEIDSLLMTCKECDYMFVVV